MHYLFFAFVFSLLVAIFAIQNSVWVPIQFLFWSFQTSLVLVILGSATFGALVILCLALLAQFRLKRNISNAVRHSQELESENKTLREQLENQVATAIKTE